MDAAHLLSRRRRPQSYRADGTGSHSKLTSAQSYRRILVTEGAPPTRATVKRNFCNISGSLHVLSQLLAGVKHAGLHRGDRDVEDQRAVLDRILVVVDEVKNLPMIGRELGQGCAHQLAAALLLQGDLRIVGAVGHSGLDGLV